jgi:5-methylcytosine-specific restriction endonuclease McrA
MAKREGVRDPVTHRTPAQIRKMSRGYNARPENVAKRVKANQARAMLMKEGKIRKGDGMDVDHKKPLRHGGSNKRSNLRVIPKSRNRGWRDGV